MKIPKEELIAILSQFNPWWQNQPIADLPTWRRSAFNELITWTADPPENRTIIISGPRQVGKTTLILQAIDQLIKDGVPPANILYATFDHLVVKHAGLDAVLDAWKEIRPKNKETDYIFLDSAQFIRDLGSWTNHHASFLKHHRTVFSGSIMPISTMLKEIGHEKCHIIKISSLSFYDYLQLKKVPLPEIPEISSLPDLFNYSQAEHAQLSTATQALIEPFHDYLIRSGYPQSALIENINNSQKHLRDTVIDKVLKEKNHDIEQMMLFLCINDRKVHDLTVLSNDLEMTKPSLQSFIHQLESMHLLYRLSPFGHNEEELHSHYKFYLTDAAIAPAILMKGSAILEDHKALNHLVETTVFSHLYTHSVINQAQFSYWEDKDNGIDLIADIAGTLVPFEVQYHADLTHLKDIKGLIDFSRQKNSIQHGYVLTKSPQDIGLLEDSSHSCRFICVPASIFCYWLGKSEISQKSILV